MISIFAKRAFLNTNPEQDFISKEKSYRGHGHLQRVSSMIRGDQIADRIGAKFNPESGYENDVCIYVKPHLKKGMDFKFEGKKAYLDMIDGHTLGQLVLKHPEIGVIVCSDADAITMKQSVPNEIVVIPQHHCNFDRTRNTRSGAIKRIGIIGEENAFEHLPKTIEKDLAEMGIELVKFSKFFSREDIISFYLSLDLQIVWRPYKKRLSNPLKIVNAASFGVPTIALDEPAFKEVEGMYYATDSYEELLDAVEAINNNSAIREGISDQIYEMAEKYHIDNIGKLYKELDK
jgi:uncharacterized protein with HEPN domain